MTIFDQYAKTIKNQFSDSFDAIASENGLIVTLDGERIASVDTDFNIRTDDEFLRWQLSEIITPKSTEVLKTDLADYLEMIIRDEISDANARICSAANRYTGLEKSDFTKEQKREISALVASFSDNLKELLFKQVWDRLQ